MKYNIETAIRRNAPLGMDIMREVRWFVTSAIAGAVFSMGFFFKLGSRIEELYYFSGSKKVLDASRVMPDFTEVLGSSLIVFFIMALCSIGVAVYCYAYHYQGSKSIYLMRRLPSRWELHRRCLTLPAVAVAFCLAAALALMLIFFSVYMAATPPACLSPGQWHKIFSLILGGAS